MEFDIEYWIDELNSKVPMRYFKRNIPEYKFTTYINHSVILFKGQHYDGVFIFLKRACDFLDTYDNINPDYLKVAIDYIKSNYEFLVKNELVTDSLVEKYDIKLFLSKN